MPTFRIDLGYDGSGFHGYARNPGVRTVQGELEYALRRILGRDVATVVAGRTDAGVHARGQVVSFEADTLDEESVAKSLRALLGPEIAVARIGRAPEGFDARFSAEWRHYRYFVDDGTVANPLDRHHTWFVGARLDGTAMNRAAAHLVGEHDFASLCRAREGRGTDRTVLEAGWDRQGSRLVFDVRATAFCHQMVRSMVALCVAVGRGRLSADDVPAVLETRDRNAARGAAPPHGLVLWEVGYQRAGRDN